MTRHEARAHDGLTVAHGGVDGRGSKDTLLEEALGESKGLGFAADKDRYDRGLGLTDLKTYRLETLVHLARVPPELIDTLRFGLHDLERLKDATHHGWGKGGGKNKTTGLVLEKFDHLAGTADEPAHGTE